MTRNCKGKYIRSKTLRELRVGKRKEVYMIHPRTKRKGRKEFQEETPYTSSWRLKRKHNPFEKS